MINVESHGESLIRSDEIQWDVAQSFRGAIAGSPVVGHTIVVPWDIIGISWNLTEIPMECHGMFHGGVIGCHGTSHGFHGIPCHVKRKRVFAISDPSIDEYFLQHGEEVERETDVSYSYCVCCCCQLRVSIVRIAGKQLASAAAVMHG